MVVAERVLAGLPAQGGSWGAAALPFAPWLDGLGGEPSAGWDRAWHAPYRVSVVIPALNEAANLPHVLPRVPRWVHEVVLVDGHSTDGTVEIAQQLWPSIRVVTQEGRGKGAALRSGFAAATGDIVVMLDADGSTDPAQLPAFVGALLAGADFAKGSRFLQGGGTADITPLRRLGNWGLTLLVRLLFGGQFSDLCFGYNAFWRQTVQALQLDADGFEIETLMNVRALQAGLKVAEVPSFEAERIHGTSRLRTIPDGWRVLRTIIREWWRSRPGLRWAGPASPWPSRSSTARPRSAMLPSGHSGPSTFDLRRSEREWA